MRALLYMSKRNLINRLRQIMRKPISLVLAIILTAYFAFLIGVGVVSLVQADFQSSYGYLAALTLWTFYSFFSNFATYAKRKGIIFKPSHTHFIFTAPIHPKLILLYGAVYNFMMTLLVSAAFVTAGILGFHLPIWKIVLLFLVLFVLETILEGSIIVFLYANERLSEKMVTMLARTIYILLIGITLFGVWYFKAKGLSLNSMKQLIDYPALQMLPVAGWNIAVFRLILLGPTKLNVICSVLYAVSVLVMALIAVKMKCDGGYYEDAAKFADDYAQMKARSKNGEMVMTVGGRKKFKKASMNYKASGAKAVFYRQLLEYKKEKWFIFSYMTVFCIAADIAAIKFFKVPNIGEKSFILLGIALYLVLLTGGYMGKWDKELKNPYLYLIPDSPAKKMWYATVMEHVKAAVDGAILVFPIGIAWNIKVFQMISIWMIYIIMQAVKLYGKVLIDSMLGSAIGETAKQIIRMAVQGGIAGIGAVLGVAVAIFIHIDLVFPVVVVYGMIMAVVLGLLTVSRFTVMEQLD